MICLIEGQETFKMVSPIYRHNIYVGVFENLKDYETPIDFFNPDYVKFP